MTLVPGTIMVIDTFSMNGPSEYRAREGSLSIVEKSSPLCMEHYPLTETSNSAFPSLAT